jgi:hypothetical protein
MAPDSADVEMEGEFVYLRRGERKALLLFHKDLLSSPIETNKSTVARPDTEDEDTEQKIINEGMPTAHAIRSCLADRVRRVQDVEEE